MGYSLGLDFGTSFTAAAIEEGGVVRVATLGNRAGAVPAVVFVREDRTLLHGEDAFLRGSGEPLRLIRNLKRRLGDPRPVIVQGEQYDPLDLIADHLRWAYDRVVELEGGPPDVVVLGHPASWRASRLEYFYEAVRRAGLKPQYVAEPHAAAMFHAGGHPLAVGDLVAAYDLGGGTFDAAVLRRTRHGFELAGEPEGEEHLGGVDFDDVVFHLVQTQLGEQWQEASRAGGPRFEATIASLRRECVTAKEALSDEPEVEVSVMLPGVVAPVVVRRADFEQLIRPAIDESIGSFQRAVSGAGASMADLAAVLLVGGSCRLPIVRAALDRIVGPNSAVLDADPKHAVARGAALLAGEEAVLRRAAAPIVGMTQEAVPAAPAAPPPLGPAGIAAPVPPVMPTALPPTLPVQPAPVPAMAAASVPLVDLAAPNASNTNRTRVLAAAALVLCLSLPAAYFYWQSRDDDETADTVQDKIEVIDEGKSSQFDEPDETDVAGASEARAVAAAEGTVPVSAGSYTLGVGAGDAEHTAEFTADVGPFHIDTFEVTNEQYLAFVQQVGAPPPIVWPGGQLPVGQELHPVVGVDFVWAQSFCESLGKRLPTETEWEVAARGPDGALLPAAAVDFETPGSRPAGSVPENVSGFGVHDAVGSVWEWVSNPYTDVEPGQQVRRGGQYGRVRDGAAMRQTVDPAGQTTVSETGFRCAADEVDPAIPPFTFDVTHENPEVEAEASGPKVDDDSPEGQLVDDTLDDNRSGFAEVTAETWRIGYHAPTWYHLEATQSSAQIVSLGGFDLADGHLRLAIYIDKTATETGKFRYGLVFRSGEESVAPPNGIAGPPRPHIFYAFTLNPRAGTWELLHADELPLRTQATGPLPGVVTVSDPANPDVLEVVLEGNVVIMSVNGTEVGRFDTKGYHIGSGNIGFFLETMDETLVHAHFDQLTVTQ